MSLTGTFKPVCVTQVCVERCACGPVHRYTFTEGLRLESWLKRPEKSTFYELKGPETEVHTGQVQKYSPLLVM